MSTRSRRWLTGACVAALIATSGCTSTSTHAHGRPSPATKPAPETSQSTTIPGADWLVDVATTQSIDFYSRTHGNARFALRCRITATLRLSATSDAVLCQDGRLARVTASGSATVVATINPAGLGIRVVTDFFVTGLMATGSEAIVYAEMSPRPRAPYEAVVAHYRLPSFALVRKQVYSPDVIQQGAIDPATNQPYYLLGEGALVDGEFHQLRGPTRGFLASLLAIGPRGQRWVSLQNNASQAIRVPGGSVVPLAGGNHVQALAAAADSLVVVEAGARPQLRRVSTAGATIGLTPLPAEPIAAVAHGEVLGVLSSDGRRWQLDFYSLLTAQHLGTTTAPDGSTGIA